MLQWYKISRGKAPSSQAGGKGCLFHSLEVVSRSPVGEASVDCIRTVSIDITKLDQIVGLDSLF